MITPQKKIKKLQSSKVNNLISTDGIRKKNHFLKKDIEKKN